MPAARQPIPASLVINHEPRRPELDPTLNIAVDVDRTGSPRNRLVTIGDSVTQGFMSGAIFRTDLSWPAVVAFELGDFAGFRRPVYEAPSGPGGLPLDFERALRSFESEFGPKLDWHEIVRAAGWLHGYLDRVEDYWERGDGAKTPTGEAILHNLAIYGWDLRDTLSLNATSVRGRLGRPRDDVWLPKQKVQDDNDRAALVVLETARGPPSARLPRFELPAPSAQRARMRPAPDRGSRPWSCSSARTTLFKPSPGSRCAGAATATPISPRRARSASGGRSTSRPNGDSSSTSFAGSRPVT